jgi:hypothetical protein
LYFRAVEVSPGGTFVKYDSRINVFDFPLTSAGHSHVTYHLSNSMADVMFDIGGVISINEMEISYKEPENFLEFF